MCALKKILTALVIPPLGLVILVLLGMRLTRRHARLGRGITVVALLALVGLSLPPVANALM
jgi:hypothetical protein